MLARLTTHKIRPDHLDRLAFIYVRLSSLAELLQNTASPTRQYDLTQRALNLSWSRERVVVIDQDPGQSGASAADRDGFQSPPIDLTIKRQRKGAFLLLGYGPRLVLVTRWTGNGQTLLASITAIN